MANKRYKVWCDTESEAWVNTKGFNNINEANDYASNEAHKHDGKELVILHVEDLELGETIGTYESFIKGVNI